MRKILKIAGIVAAVLLVLIGAVYFFSGIRPWQPDNIPYQPDTPEPPAHDGIFVSSYGKMSFNGDGRTVVLEVNEEFSRLSGIPAAKTEAEYVFLSGALPPHGSMPTRYDNAHELEIRAGSDTWILQVGIAAEDGKTTSRGVGIVTEDRIPILFRGDSKFFSAVFEKQK